MSGPKVTVRLHGVYSLNKIREIEVQAQTVKEALMILEKKSPADYKFKEVKAGIICVNNVNINKLKGLKTKLNGKDTVGIFFPSSGG